MGPRHISVSAQLEGEGDRDDWIWIWTPPLNAYFTDMLCSFGVAAPRAAPRLEKIEKCLSFGGWGGGAFSDGMVACEASNRKPAPAHLFLFLCYFSCTSRKLEDLCCVRGACALTTKYYVGSFAFTVLLFSFLFWSRSLEECVSS